MSYHLFFSCLSLIVFLSCKTLNYILDISWTTTNTSSKTFIRQLEYQQDSCENIKDCFNCTMYSQVDFSCEWQSGQCVQTSYIPSYTHWFDYFNNCLSDSNSKAIMKSNCGGTLDSTIPFTASLTDFQGYYGTKNIYCKWNAYNTEMNKEIFLNFTKLVPDLHDQYALEIFYIDGRNIIHFLQTKYYVLNANLIESVSFHYFTSQLKTTLPFTISYTYSLEGNETYLGLFIAIGVIVFICIVCSIVFYKCSRIIMANNRRRQIEQHEAEQNANILNTNAPALIAEQRIAIERRNQEIKVKNSSKMLELFENELMPMEYKKSMNEFSSSNCTICLEDFKKNALVVKLFCKHLFHYKCLKEWCEKAILNPKCPNCNIEIITKSEVEDMEVVNIPPIPRNNNINNHNNNLNPSRFRSHNQVVNAMNHYEAIPRVPRPNRQRENSSDGDFPSININESNDHQIREEQSMRINANTNTNSNANNFIVRDFDSVENQLVNNIRRNNGSNA